MKARLPQAYQNQGASNMNQMIKQAQKMQDDIAAVQAKLDETEFTASAGGGMIELTMTGGKVLKSVKLNPDCIDKENPEDLEDIIVAGVNAILQKVEEESTKEMEKVTGGLNMPGLF
ncbi:MAG: YbaB/EbfC family nucleoid-associated protein [Firmicutes bacterium]|nr:YbaB/EbfC family nucleoid-associated protein [[Eubacterium] siraeum]MCM1488479.1 YbaB/EbfC family nucleoid-associated protein [Bacillota bacterium]